MRFFAKKCAYCGTKIESKQEIEKDVKVPGYAGTRSKNFCSKDHVAKYETEIEEHMTAKSGGGGCCG